MTVRLVILALRWTKDGMAAAMRRLQDRWIIDRGIQLGFDMQCLRTAHTGTCTHCHSVQGA